MAREGLRYARPGPVAQWSEQRTHNPSRPGSNPGGPIKTSRKHLDQVASEKLGANPDTVYKSGLEPLRKTGRAKVRKEDVNGGWDWRLSLEEMAA